MDERHDWLDEALDVALASYGTAPQREGLEQRILSRISETPSRTHSTGSFLLALAAAAVIAMCLSWWMMRTTVIQTRPATTAMLPLHRIEPPAPAVVIPQPASVLGSTGKSHRPRTKRTEPKLPRFPVPSPMTSEERALLELVAYHPKDIPPELSHLDGPVKPIDIAAVEIKPVESESYTREK